MSMKTTAISALLLCAVASSGLAKGTKLSVPLIVPTDPRGSYTLLEFEPIADHVILATTLREGASGAVYSARVIDCGHMRIKEVAEGHTLAEVTANRERNRSQITAAGLAPPEQGSVSDYLSHQACDATANR